MERDEGASSDEVQDRPDQAAGDARWESSFYHLPSGAWTEVDVDTTELLTALAADLQATLRALPTAAVMETAHGKALAPVELLL